MRVVAFSDSHHKYAGGIVEVPAGDLLIFAGDACLGGSFEELIHFGNWWNRLPHRYKLLIPGNHDGIFETDPGLASSELKNTHVLIDDAIEIEGIRIYGSPYTKEFMNWYFQLWTPEESAEKWAKIPADTQILIIHGPPYGILDSVEEVENGVSITRHCGCRELLKAIQRVKPLIACFGHIHDSGGRTTVVDGTKFINASICNEAYELVNKPIVFEI